MRRKNHKDIVAESLDLVWNSIKIMVASQYNTPNHYYKTNLQGWSISTTKRRIGGVLELVGDSRKMTPKAPSVKDNSFSGNFQREMNHTQKASFLGRFLISTKRHFWRWLKTSPKGHPLYFQWKFLSPLIIIYSGASKPCPRTPLFRLILNCYQKPLVGVAENFPESHLIYSW